MTWTKLHEACERYDKGQELLPLVSECKEDILSTDDKGATALHLLCWGGENPNLEVVKAILGTCPQAASAQDMLGNTPLHVACACPFTCKPVVQLLLDAFPDAASTVNHEGMLPLHMACRYASHNDPVIGLLLEVFPYAVRSAIKVGPTVVLHGCCCCCAAPIALSNLTHILWLLPP
jgi:ankyrin repeat protein